MNRQSAIGTLISVLILVGVVLLVGSCKNSGSGDKTTNNQATHADNQSHEGNDMAEMQNMQGTSPSAPKKEEQKKAIYRCPMHPQYTSDRPGKCPICRMDLVKDEEAPPETKPATGEGAMQNMPKGFGMVQLSAEKIQLIGIHTTSAHKGDMTRTIRASAVVAADERRVKQVQSKIQGWIEKLSVNFTGQYVNKGQALMEIYSPDLVSTQEEYLLALRNLNSLKDAQQTTQDGAQNLVNAARRRLEYWDISDAQIRRLEQTRQPLKTLILYSPIRGYVIESKAIQGMQVELGMPLYTIADLSQVWVLASVYEQDLALVKNGMQVVFHTDTYPGRDFSGKVSYINPLLDPQNRTATVRAELPNPDMVLRPGMYGDATLVKEIPDALTVPASAVMDNGEVKVVYVQTQPGHFMPRQVKVGVRTSEKAQILDGLMEGESVVVEGNFMLDSESRLRAAAGGVSIQGHHH